jgi:hypothetical protein
MAAFELEQHDSGGKNQQWFVFYEATNRIRLSAEVASRRSRTASLVPRSSLPLSPQAADREVVFNSSEKRLARVLSPAPRLGPAEPPFKISADGSKGAE